MFFLRLYSPSQSDIPARALTAFPFPFESLWVSSSESTLAREGGGRRAFKERSRIREIKSRLYLGVEFWGAILVGAKVARVTRRTLASTSLARWKAGAEEGSRGPKSAARDCKKTSAKASG